VLQFPSIEQARDWWQSEQYRPLVKLRQPPVADTRAFLIDGIDLAKKANRTGANPVRTHPARTAQAQRSPTVSPKEHLAAVLARVLVGRLVIRVSLERSLCGLEDVGDRRSPT
jgi:hypothetical protein